MYLKDNDTYGYKGFDDSTEEVWKMVDERIQACIDLDMYVIADYHGLAGDGATSTHLSKAKDYFNRVITKYKDYPNVIYELFNEPCDNWDTLKTYSETMINYIRAVDTDAFCIVSTPNNDNNWDGPKTNPITLGNIAYCQHFYKGIDTSFCPNINSGLPMFVSEFGVGDAGSELADTADYEASKNMTDILKHFNISWCMWALTGRDDCAHSVIKSSSTKSQKWNSEELSPTGQWVIKQF